MPHEALTPEAFDRWLADGPRRCPTVYGKRTETGLPESRVAEVKKEGEGAVPLNVRPLPTGFEAPIQAEKRQEPEKAKITRNLDAQYLAAGAGSEDRWWESREDP